MKKLIGWILFLAGAWMLVAPQALTGLKQLKWMYNTTFPGEVMLGIAVLVVAFYLVELKPGKNAAKASH